MRRDRFLGGTDVAAVLGLNPWRSAFDVWAEKTGRVLSQRPETPAMAWGKRLEPLVAEAFSEATGLRLVPTEPVFLPDRPHLGGSPDRLIVDDGGAVVGVLEIKTARDGSAWGPDGGGEDDVPPHYVLQASWYAGLLGVEAVHVAALIGGSDLRTYRWAMNRQAWEEWAETAHEWWVRHVVGGEPPEAAAKDAAKAWSAARTTQGLRAATADEDELLERLAEATARLRDAESGLEKARADVEAAIGEAEGIEGSRYVATWRRNRPTMFTDWKAAALEAGVGPEIVGRFTTERPGARVFRLLPKKM